MFLHTRLASPAVRRVNQESIPILHIRTRTVSELRISIAGAGLAPVPAKSYQISFYQPHIMCRPLQRRTALRCSLVSTASLFFRASAMLPHICRRS